MPLPISNNWPWIVRHFEKSLKSGGYYAFASISPDGAAHVTPIASLVLNDDCSGFYSEVFANQMAANFQADQRVCIMDVCMGFGFWLKAFLTGRFGQWPGVRLYGTVARQTRRAEPGEVERWLRRVRRYKCFKGYDLLWKDVRTVRDIVFDRYEPVRLGAMTRHLPN